ncbi:MAG: hypothetical protein FWF49_01875 [Oscillospiraceae bacterium]|nr:hypothetical protein [Oscillospiraceae bacterium]
MDEQNICGTCQYFIQHYVPWGDGYTAIHIGHCICLRAKTRSGDTKACERYRRNELSDYPHNMR